METARSSLLAKTRPHTSKKRGKHHHKNGQQSFHASRSATDPFSMEELGLCHVQCILPPMRLNRPIGTVIFLVGVMTITGGCATDAVEPAEQLKLSRTPPLLEKDTTSYTDKVTDTLGGYDDETVSFLTDDCGVGAYSMATGKAGYNLILMS